MTNAEFQIEMEKSYLRSKRLLIKKEVEYSQGKDRLDQFKKVSLLNSIPPTEALWGMTSKHITSIADMVKNPTNYPRKKWNGKVTDLRNYTFLLDAVLTDLEII